MNRFKNKELLQNLVDSQNWNLVQKFMTEFQSKVDSTFICDTVLVKSKNTSRQEFQIKDTKEKCKDFFGAHTKHEFALSLGEKYFTFYIRLWIEKFEEKKELTTLKITPTKYKSPPKDRSKREGYISKIESLKDIEELINFVFIECLGDFLKNPISKKIGDFKSQTKHQQELEKEIENARQLNKEERLEKSAKYENLPKKIVTQSFDYQRNPFVIIDALERAKGICEKCNRKAPFLRDKDNSPYLEIHHKLPLSEGGEDTLDNVVALCPNCHRQAHYGKKTY